MRVDSSFDNEDALDVSRPTILSKIREMPKISYKIVSKIIVKNNLISLKNKAGTQLSHSPTRLKQKSSH